ncbi:2Fe-2S iron-sulfur cluster-binding protein [Pseudoduganella sp. UC29_106]|uniref:2Fe-2S iron-sulfur cluster-binding protein n=1 Tax=Pseudoduganella sp. UC29_106 TaxID=3374553 RepID=UPI00375700A8
MTAALPAAATTAAPEAAWHGLTVARVIAETSDATSVELHVPLELAAQFAYRPGQFLTLRVAHPDGMLSRCYSLSSSPGIDALPRVTIKRVAGGRASNWLCDSLTEGTQVEVMAPAGVFVPERLDGDFTLLAGGSGITPMLSIIKAVLARGEGKVWLLYANRDPASVIFRNELQALAEAHPQRLVVQHWLDQVQGMPSTQQLQALLARQPAGQYFICGPKPFMDGAQAALKALSVPRERVRVERFVSLDVAGAAADAAMEVPPSADAVAARLEVALDGAEHALDVPPGASLLDTMLAAGLKPPHSCRTGSCGACMCKVEQGEVQLRLNAVLDEDDLADGWTLACQGIPASATLRLRFPD